MEKPAHKSLIAWIMTTAFAFNTFIAMQLVVRSDCFEAAVLYSLFVAFLSTMTVGGVLAILGDAFPRLKL